MKLFISLLLLSISIFPLKGITITGKVVDSSTGTPLAYVSIGIVNTSIGTITDENGRFEFKTDNNLLHSTVRFSMISYKSQSFTIEELLDKENTIALVSAPVQLAEIVVKPGKLRKIGTTGFSRFGSWCGWGGSYNRRGCEIGSKITLGNYPVLIKSLHIHVHRQAFDSSYYRLHIRTIFNNTPMDELLNQNIIFPISRESGWVTIDLSKYNIILQGEVAVTLEWIKVAGLNKDRSMAINKKETSEYVLFNTKSNHKTIYTRWGTEAKWNLAETGSPSIYLTVQ